MWENVGIQELAINGRRRFSQFTVGLKWVDWYAGGGPGIDGGMVRLEGPYGGGGKGRSRDTWSECDGD
jgi:hypothetical protein